MPIEYEGDIQVYQWSSVLDKSDCNVPITFDWWRKAFGASELTPKAVYVYHDRLKGGAYVSMHPHIGNLVFLAMWEYGNPIDYAFTLNLPHIKSRGQMKKLLESLGVQTI